MLCLAAMGCRAQGFVLESPAFKNGEAIPAQYTAQGPDLSPPLAWSGVPAGTESFVLIVDDPDAPSGTWVHWVVFDIPARWRDLPEDLVYSDAFSRSGIGFGRNSWKGTTWRGPNPPSGRHRYFFKLYALDVRLGFDLKPDKEELLAAIDGHVLGIAVLTGTYERQR